MNIYQVLAVKARRPNPLPPIRDWIYRPAARLPDPVARSWRGSGATTEAVTEAQTDQYRPIAEPARASHC
jgi:hypothetical protein